MVVGGQGVAPDRRTFLTRPSQEQALVLRIRALVLIRLVGRPAAMRFSIFVVAYITDEALGSCAGTDLAPCLLWALVSLLRHHAGPRQRRYVSMQRGTRCGSRSASESMAVAVS